MQNDCNDYLFIYAWRGPGITPRKFQMVSKKKKKREKNNECETLEPSFFNSLRSAASSVPAHQRLGVWLERVKLSSAAIKANGLMYMKMTGSRDISSDGK